MNRPGLPIILISAFLGLPGCASAITPGGSVFPTLPSTPTVTATPLPTIALPTPTLEPTPTETPPPTSAVPPCDATTGQVVPVSFPSAITGRDLRYEIYLPPCYNSAGRRYPYLIMLHGLGEGMDMHQWVRLGLPQAADSGIQHGALPPMVIVMPNGLDAQHDWDDGPYPNVIVDELMPHLEATYCLWNESSRRAIGGLSRGGYWAFGIAFTYPELFDRVGGHSAFFYQGDYTPFNPFNMLATAPGIERLNLYLDHGLDDHLVDQNMLAFVNNLRARGIEPQYIINPVGGHVEDYWAAHTADYLAFYAEDWPRNIIDFPTCNAL